MYTSKHEGEVFVLPGTICLCWLGKAKSHPIPKVAPVYVFQVAYGRGKKYRVIRLDETSDIRRGWLVHGDCLLSGITTEELISAKAMLKRLLVEWGGLFNGIAGGKQPLTFSREHCEREARLWELDFRLKTKTK